MEPAPAHEPSPGPQPDSVSSQVPPNAPSPQGSQTDTPPAQVESAPDPSSTSTHLLLSDEEVVQWTRSHWSDEVDQLASFGQKSWGTAYQTIAEVQLVLRISKCYKMVINFASHQIFTGWFDDRDGKKRYISFQHLGSYLNGQSAGTWMNKLTFFFAVYHFLVQTQGVAEEGSIGRELEEVRQAMTSWGVFRETNNSFLPHGDPRASYLITPVRSLICQYMARV